MLTPAPNIFSISDTGKYTPKPEEKGTFCPDGSPVDPDGLAAVEPDAPPGFSDLNPNARSNPAGDFSALNPNAREDSTAGPMNREALAHFSGVNHNARKTAVFAAGPYGWPRSSGLRRNARKTNGTAHRWPPRYQAPAGSLNP